MKCHHCNKKIWFWQSALWLDPPRSRFIHRECLYSHLLDSMDALGDSMQDILNDAPKNTDDEKPLW